MLTKPELFKVIRDQIPVETNANGVVPAGVQVAEEVNVNGTARPEAVAATNHDVQQGILTNVSWFISDGTDSHYTPTACFHPLLGDADIPGAAYTYARSLQFSFFVELIVNALHSKIVQEIEDGQADAAEPDADTIAQQCDLKTNMKLNPFPSWQEISVDSWYCMITAAIIALTVQWGTLL